MLYGILIGILEQKKDIRWKLSTLNDVFLNPCFLKDRDNVLVISASVMVISISGMTKIIVVPVNADKVNAS